MRIKTGLACLASVASAAGVCALVPSAAHAHPCAVNWSLTTSTFLSANDSGTAWAGGLPTPSVNDSDCAVVETSLPTGLAQSDAAADDPVEATKTYTKSANMTPVGYSARIPPPGTGNSLADINSDIAFKGNLAFQGHWSGFRVIDISDPANPTQLYNTEACRHTSGQGDVVVHGNILVRTWDSASNATPNENPTCMGHATGLGFEGIHIWDISNPAAPVYVRQLRMAATGNDAGAPAVGCGAHTATGVPDDARGYLYLYVGGSSGTCNGIDIVRIKLSDPSDTKYLSRATHGRAGVSCHDNNVLMNVGATKVGYAMCAGGNGLAMYKFDMAKAATEAGTAASPGGVENPTLIWAKRMPDETTNPAVTTGHSGSFTYDGKLLIYGHEPGGGTQASCEETDSILFRSLYFLNPEDGEIKGSFVQPRPQGATENCTWHNFNVVPTYKGYYGVSGNYEMGISVFDFSNPAAVQQIAYADPAEFTPGATNTQPTAGNWSTHYYNGRIYESDIRRGVLIWNLDHDSMRRVRQVDLSNPQTQTTSFAQDLEGAAITIAQPVEGAQFKQGAAQTVTYSCTDSDSGVESCVGPVASGGALDTSRIGVHEFKVTATDRAGNVTTKSVTYMVNSADFPGSVSGTVPATLSLSLGAAPSFGAFTPGVAREYTATGGGNIISTAGNATLTVADPSTTNTGKLVNGTFTLANPLMASATGTGATAGAGGAVGGSAAPTTLLTYSAPVSNSTLALTFKQSIGANEGRCGRATTARR